MVEDEALLRALRVLQESTAGVEGAGYYGALARGLARAFAMRYGMVAEVDPKRPGKAFPLAFWDSQAMSTLAPYDLRGTPCAGVAGGEVCHYPEHVARLFPLDALLVELRIESYIGVPVAGAGGEVLGLLVAFDREVQPRLRHLSSVLSGFAARAGWNIERARLIKRLERQATRAQALADIATSLHSAHARPDAALQSTCGRVRDALGVTAVSVLLFGERGGGIERRAQVGLPAAWIDHLATQRIEELILPMLDGPRLVGREVLERTPEGALYRGLGLVAGALAPLRCEGGLVGFVTALQFDEQRTLSPEDLAWLDAVAGLLGQVVLASRLEARMLHAQKLESLGVLAGGIAHDFNNLLVGILGNVGLALRELPADTQAEPLLRDVQRAAGRAAELTAQMLAYAGKGRITVEAVNLNAVVAEIAGLLAAVISKKATLRTDFARGLPDVAGDATQIRQVVMNLITNASDALGERSGTITVRTWTTMADRALLATGYVDEQLPEGRYVCLSVADDGVGMDAETRARIFDPFFTTKFAGRGLGLAAVLGILRGHRGAIRLESERGRGACFTVLLPCAEGARAEVAAADSGIRPRAVDGSMVLIADDEPAVRLVASRVLERAGYRVCVASDGRAAVEVFKANAAEISAVLIDMTMPQLRGDEVIVELRRLRPDVRVVLSSGFIELDGARTLEHVRFLPKPWTPEALLAAVDGRPE
jgi:signal transduction histidine kinase